MSGYITGLERCLCVQREGSGPQEKARRMLQKLTRNDGCVSSKQGSYLEKGGCLGGGIPGVMEVFLCTGPGISNAGSPALLREMKAEPISLITSLAMRPGTCGRLRCVCLLPGTLYKRGSMTKLKFFTLAVPWAALSDSEAIPLPTFLAHQAIRGAAGMDSSRCPSASMALTLA